MNINYTIFVLDPHGFNSFGPRNGGKNELSQGVSLIPTRIRDFRIGQSRIFIQIRIRKIYVWTYSGGGAI